MTRYILARWFVVCVSLHFALAQDPTIDQTSTSFLDIKQKVQNIIYLEFQSNLLNWVKTNGQFKGYSDVLYIQGDHIPPKKFYEAVGLNSGNQPVLAISGFDHNSELWRLCTTGNTKFLDIFVLFSFENWTYQKKFGCAIFANLKCLRDKEISILQQYERIFPNRRAFARYHTGFVKLVEAHWMKGNIDQIHKTILVNWISDIHEGTTWFQEEKNMWNSCCTFRTNCENYGLQNYVNSRNG